MRSATTGAVAAVPATLVRCGLAALAAVLSGVLLAGPALAAPEPDPSAAPTASASVVDPARPTARVVHGPNCTDGFVRVEVTNGSAGRTVELQYDGAGVGTAATLAPGEQTTLEGPEVAAGSTVDVQVGVTAADGTADVLPLGSYPRPTQQDCDGVVDPPPSPTPTSEPTATTDAPAPTTTVPPTSLPPTSGSPTTPPTTPVPPTSAPSTPRSTPSATTSAPGPTGSPTASTPATGGPTVPPGGTASAGQVSPGSVVTIRGTGFDPGEQVSVTLAGVSAPLATVTADDQGRVEAVVQIPRDVVLGPAVVQLVGEDSAAATQVALDVAARETAEVAGRTPWPLAVAGLALLAVAAALVAATRRPRADDWQPPTGPA